MKKLLTIAATMLIAAATYAATTSWDFYAYYYDTDGNDLVGSLTLLQDGNTLLASDLVNGEVEDTVEVAYGEGETVTARLATTLNSGDIIYKDYTFEMLLPRAGYPDNQSSLGAYAADVGYAFVGDDGVDLNMTVAEAEAAGWTVTPVPEPTSVALLALGLAALGLKRKVA